MADDNKANVTYAEVFASQLAAIAKNIREETAAKVREKNNRGIALDELAKQAQDLDMGY